MRSLASHARALTGLDWLISPRLLQVPGVADVVSYGGLVREVHVEPDVSKIVDLGVNLNDVFAALKKASSNATGGYVERGSETFVIRSLGIFSSLDDLQHVRVGFNETRPVERAMWPRSTRATPRAPAAAISAACVGGTAGRASPDRHLSGVFR
ncbi:MAG TPA: efflux RND transporter permease subunit [Polyangiaceae bacterium]|nr:efflux RND transporter permease subunit [Polyangiaceae bacterium]